VLVTLPKLQVLSLANNQLSGNLFSVGGALASLRNNKIAYFDISNNQLFAELVQSLSWLALFDPARTDLVRAQPRAAAKCPASCRVLLPHPALPVNCLGRRPRAGSGRFGGERGGGSEGRAGLCCALPTGTTRGVCSQGAGAPYHYHSSEAPQAG
jgi:hypothetical protein